MDARAAYLRNHSELLEAIMEEFDYEDGDICDEMVYPYLDFTQIHWVRVLFLVIYIVVMFLSVFGNSLVIWTVYSNKHMRTVTNYYIVNLATCDFLVAVFVLPLKLLEYTAPCSWHVFGQDSLCSALYFTLPVFVFASVLTLVAISLER
jgi:leucokinin receptor